MDGCHIVDSWPSYYFCKIFHILKLLLNNFFIHAEKGKEYVGSKSCEGYPQHFKSNVNTTYESQSAHRMMKYGGLL